MLTQTMTEPQPQAVAQAPVRVVIVDDHPLFRRGIRFTLEAHPDIAVVGEADNGRDALALIAEYKPDVALLDYRMPGLDGVGVCAALAASHEQPATASLLLSAYEDAEIVWSAVSAGAAGYLAKTASPREICEAVVRVGRGGIAYSERAAAGVAEGLARHFSREERA